VVRRASWRKVVRLVLDALSLRAGCEAHDWLHLLLSLSIFVAERYVQPPGLTIPHRRRFARHRFVNALLFQHILGWSDVGVRQVGSSLTRPEIMQARVVPKWLADRPQMAVPSCRYRYTNIHGLRKRNFKEPLALLKTPPPPCQTYNKLSSQSPSPRIARDVTLWACAYAVVLGRCFSRISSIPSARKRSKCAKGSKSVLFLLASSAAVKL
jgi:hypothetical protein